MLIGPIIVAIDLVIAAIAFAVVGALLQTADGSAELRLNRNEAELARQRADLDSLRSELRDAQVEIDRLSEAQAMQAAQPQAMPAQPATARPGSATPEKSTPIWPPEKSTPIWPPEKSTPIDRITSDVL